MHITHFRYITFVTCATHIADMISSTTITTSPLVTFQNTQHITPQHMPYMRTLCALHTLWYRIYCRSCTSCVTLHCITLHLNTIHYVGLHYMPYRHACMHTHIHTTTHQPVYTDTIASVHAHVSISYGFLTIPVHAYVRRIVWPTNASVFVHPHAQL